jgi:uncharacterized FAD-dependent dehydrogenase
MLRLTNIQLPLDHQEADIKKAILNKLSISEDQLIDFTVFKRGYDARKKAKIILIYTLDVDTCLNDELLERFVKDNQVKASPDMRYNFVAQAPEKLTQRPVVIGFGPCGLFIGLVLAQMGFNPIILERGKEVRQRTKDTFGFWRKKILNTESNVQFGEGGAGTFLTVNYIAKLMIKSITVVKYYMSLLMLAHQKKFYLSVNRILVPSNW